jgi:hypothetical protein
MIDTLNSVACLVLMLLTFPVAKAMHHRGFWAQRIGLWIIVAMLAIEVCAPMWEGMPRATWFQTVFNVMLAGVAYRARYQIMAAVRLTMGKDAVETKHPLRRAEDLEEVALVAVRGGYRKSE